MAVTFLFKFQDLVIDVYQFERLNLFVQILTLNQSKMIAA